MRELFVPRVGGILSADIAVPEHEREVRFYSRVLHTGENPPQELRTWDKPKPAPISEVQIGILIDALSGSRQALTNFLNMSASVRRTYTTFYLAAKGEDTRKRRLEQIIERLKENKKPM